MADDLKAFATKMGRLAEGMNQLEQRRLAAVGRRAKKEIEHKVRGASGGDLRLSGVGRKGGRVGVRDQPSTGEVKIVATGPIRRRVARTPTSPPAWASGSAGPMPLPCLPHSTARRR